MLHEIQNNITLVNHIIKTQLYLESSHVILSTKLETNFSSNLHIREIVPCVLISAKINTVCTVQNN